MSIGDLYDHAAKLHVIDEERRRTQITEDASVKITRRLLIDLVRHLHHLEERITELQAETQR